MAGIIRRCSSEDKLELLAEAARYDVCLATCSGNAAGGSGRLRDPSNPASRWIYPAYVPGRGRVGILKILQTNVCINNCRYCHFASSRDRVRRVTLASDELAKLFMGFYDLKLCHGIFISSGIGADPEGSMAKMIETASILRTRYGFRDYIHLKILPGCSRAMVFEAAKVANRISINLESPAPSFLKSAAPDKQFYGELINAMRWAGEAVKTRAMAASQITQFVVGAAGESDLDILQTVDGIYRDFHVFRSYFSAFQPPDGEDPPLSADHQPLRREHRLYQTDFLLRGYGFRLPDLVFDQSQRLPAQVDPKTAHAMMHPELFPVDVNTASEQALLKVPGIGPVAARRILYTRRRQPYRGVDGLRASGAWVRRAAPYILFSGKRERGAQGWLFESGPPAGWTTGVRKTEGGDRYEYPGQTGKRLYYSMGKSTDNIRCR